MSSIRLGQDPHDLTVVLPADGDFIATIRTKDGSDWPAGISVELKLDATVFTATVTGSAITFDEDEAVIAPLLAAVPRRSRLYYIDGATRLIWAAGGVEVRP